MKYKLKYKKHLQRNVFFIKFTNIYHYILCSYIE